MWRGINKDAPHPNAAKLWIEFSATDEHQRHLSEKVARYTTSKNVKLGFPRPDLKFHKIDWKWLKVNKDDMCKRYIKEVNMGREETKK
jgi:ABC-type Fe3+ transport system substrate-binding protein